MGILSKIAAAKSSIESLDSKGVRGTLGDESLSRSQKIRDIAKIGATRLARKTWEASGAGEVKAVAKTSELGDKGLDYINKQNERKRQAEEDRARLENKGDQGESTFEKTKRLTKESHDRAEERRQIREGEGIGGGGGGDTYSQEIAANTKVIADAVTQSPLLQRPFGAKAGQGGAAGLLDTLLQADNLLSGGKLASKAGGLLSKIPGLGKLAGGAAAAAGTVMSTVPLAKKAGSALAGKVAPGAVTDVVAKTVGKEALETGAKSAGKSILKKIPLIGAMAGLGFGAQRAFSGDWKGAGLELASGLASTIPGLGTAASLGIDGVLAARDISGTMDGGEGLETSQDALKKAGNSMFGDGQPLSRQLATANDGQWTRLEKPRSAEFKAGEDASGFDQTRDLFDLFLTEALDPDRGIYVRTVKDTFGRDATIGDAIGVQPGGEAGSNDLAPQNLKRTITDLEEAERAVARPIDTGSGFVPNSQRPESPRANLGNGYVASPRVDASRVTRADGTGTRSKGFKGFGADVDSHISEAAQKYGMDEKVLRGFVKMEDGWTGKMSPTGAIGTGQFIQSTWDNLAKTREGQSIGMSTIGNRFRTQEDPRFDKRTNTLATALLAKQNAKMLKDAGLEPTGENLYMMHNIGPGVIPAIKGGQVSEKTLTAMRQNGMKPGQTPQDFVAMQKKNFNTHYESANAQGVKGADPSQVSPFVKTAFNPSAGQSSGQSSVAPGGYVSPYEGNFRVSSEMDPNRVHPVTGKTRPHKGVDVAMPSGTALKAMSNGQIEKIGYEEKGYGNYVDVRHDDGSMARYAHLSKIADGLEKGAKVQAGQQVALSGNTGIGTGAHLHMEYKTASGELRDFRKVLAETAAANKDTQVAAAKAERATLSSPEKTQQKRAAQELTASQNAKNAESQKPVVVVSQGGGRDSGKKAPSTTAGDTKPEIVVRNNESSIRRVSDNMISRTMT